MSIEDLRRPLIAEVTTTSIKVEELINEIVGSSLGSSAKFLSLLLLTSILMTAAMMTFLPMYIGYIPYEEWKCVSDRCKSILVNSTYDRETMCANNLVVEVDFKWTAARTTYATDWNIYCHDEEKVAMVNSFFFIGALCGLLLATTLFDTIGRKRASLLAALVGFSATLVMAFVRNASQLIITRVFQGCGTFVMFTGVYVWGVEYTPRRLRSAQIVFKLLCWTAGSSILDLIGYLNADWRHVPLIVCVAIVILAVPLLFIPESPRFNLVMGKEDEAKKTLTRFAKIFGKYLSFDITNLSFDNNYTPSYIKQLKDFWHYKRMLKETLLLMVCWFNLGALLYAIGFSWDKLGGSLYVTVLVSQVASLSGSVILFVGVATLGRKRNELLMLALAGACFLLGMLDVKVFGDWTASRIACVAGSVFVASAFACTYLITAELAPTSHRGMILSACSGSARIGSFVGPFIALLYNVLDRRIVLAIFAGMAVLCGGIFSLLPDTTGKSIPDTPDEMRRNREAVREEEEEEGPTA